MHRLAWRIRLLGGLAMMALTGCYSYYPYGYGPQGSYPGMYNTAPPAGAVPSGPVLGPPSTFTPQGSAVPQYRQSFGPAAPTGVTPTYGPSQPAGGNPVPEYNDPAPINGGSDDLQFNDDQSSPFGYRQGTRPMSETVASASAAGESAESFLQPVPVPREGTTQLVSGTQDEPYEEEQKPSPFDHDREHYRWLRGVVDYDAGDESWNIIYNARPGAEDQFGGSITLVGDDRFSQLRDNDVVLVEGRIDADARDQFGKPRYRVDNLARLVPK